MRRLVAGVVLAVMALMVMTGAARATGTPEPEPQQQEKVKVCHVPPGNPANAHTIEVSPQGARAHLREHELDTRGECPPVVEPPTPTPQNPPACGTPRTCPGPIIVIGPPGPQGPQGVPGPQGPAGPQGPPGQTPQPRVCTSRRVVNVTLPRRFRNLTEIRAWVAGKRITLPVVNGKVRVSFVGVQAPARFGRVVAAAVWVRGQPVAARLYAICTKTDGVGQINVPPGPLPAL